MLFDGILSRVVGVIILRDVDDELLRFSIDRLEKDNDDAISQKTNDGHDAYPPHAEYKYLSANSFAQQSINTPNRAITNFSSFHHGPFPRFCL